MILANCTVLQNIAMTNDENELKKAKEILMKYGLEELSSHMGNKLSGGEKRIISILRGFFTNSDIFLLDEPTNDLDYEKVDLLQSILKDLRSHHTVVMVSHDDRMLLISDCILRIYGKKINYVTSKEKNGEEKIEEKNINNQNADRRFFARSLKFNIISVLFISVMVVFALYLTKDLKFITPPEISDIAENEVDIFSGASMEGQVFQTSGAIPIAAIKCFDESLSMNDKVKILKNISDHISKNIYFPNLNMTENKNYDVFSLEYANSSYNQYYSVLDTYAKMNHKEEKEDIDTSKYFQISDSRDRNENRNKISLEKDRFEQSRKRTIKESDCPMEINCTFQAFSLKNITFFDFIKKKEIQDLTESNAFIRSKETGEFVRQAYSFQEMKSKGENIFIVGIIMLFAESVGIFLLLYSDRQKLIIFYHTYLDRENIKKIVKKRYANEFTGVLSILVMSLIGWNILGDNGKELGRYICIIISAVYILLSYKITNIIIRQFINKICNWKYR